MEDMFDLIIQLSENPNPWVLFSLASQILALLHIPSILLRRRNPIGQLAWIMSLFIFPFFGVMGWWIFGRTRIDKKKAIHVKKRSAFSRHSDPSSDENVQAQYQFATTQGNDVQTLLSGQEAYKAILSAIANARHHIHLEFYIWKDDTVGNTFLHALVDAKKRGVEVRIIVDAVGSSEVTGSFFKPLKAVGAQVGIFLPFRLFRRSLRLNFRNHRKIVIIDGCLGFTGGLNIGDEYNQWYDTFFQIVGPMVSQLQEVFCEDWYFVSSTELKESAYLTPAECSVDLLTDSKSSYTLPPASDLRGRIIASGPDRDIEMIHSVFFIAITQATERIYITTPYFIPDQAILAALRTAVMRGVDVRLLLPGKSDVRIAQWASRAYFEELICAGVQIFEYQKEILHAKMMVIDDRFTIIGSANMDIRSFRLQFEINMAMDSVEQNGTLGELFLEKLSHSIEIDGPLLETHSTLRKLGEAAARLFSPLL